MYYINATPTENGNYGNPFSNPAEGMLALPDELLADYISAKGFVSLTVEDNTVTALVINQAAYDAYIADHPDEPEPEPEATTEELINIILGVTADE